MLKRLINGKINSIATAALLVALSSLLSRLLGVFRDRILAGTFGAGDTLDIYYAAFKAPDLIFNLLILGALSAGFIPIFTHLLKNEADIKKNEEAWRLVSNIINILGLALILLSVLAMFFSSAIVSVFAPGFSHEKRQLTAELTKIMFLSPLFLGLSSVLGGILQSTKRFFVYSLAPIFYNVGIIVGALYFVPWLGIAGLAWGVVFGALLHFLIQLPTVIKLGFRYSRVIEFQDLNLKKIGRMMVPRTMSLAISQINLLISTAISSTLMSGSLAIFNFANNLQTFPIGIFGISFATAVFPELSRHADDRAKLVESFSKTIRQILFFIIPSTVLFLILPAQLVRVIYGSGKFDWSNTVLTIDTLSWFSISLFAQASIPLLVRMFYARQNSKKPFYVGLVSVLCDVVLSLWLSRVMGVAGIALAFSIANIINFGLLWLVLRRDLGNLDELKIFKSVLKFMIAGLVCALLAQSMKTVILPIIDQSKVWGVLFQGLFAGSIGLLGYLIICALLKSEEFNGFWQGFNRRLPWKKVDQLDQTEARGI